MDPDELSEIPRSPEKREETIGDLLDSFEPHELMVLMAHLLADKTVRLARQSALDPPLLLNRDELPLVEDALQKRYS